MKIPICINCNQEMILEKKSDMIKGKLGLNFKIKRFTCELCDYSESIYGDGNIQQNYQVDFREEEKEDRKVNKY